MKALESLTASSLVPIKVRAHLLRRLGVQIGPDSGIQSGVTIIGPYLTIGRSCFINCNCLFDAVAPIILGDNVHVGFGVSILTSTHKIGATNRRAGVLEWWPVHIGNGAWIGANATILPGVIIGAGCVIAAGSVVTADTKPDTLYTGVPAVSKRPLSAVT